MSSASMDRATVRTTSTPTPDAFDEDAERLGVWYIYRLSATQLTHTDFGPQRNAHFEYAKPADKAGDP
jgi:hypothetical protein